MRNDSSLGFKLKCTLRGTVQECEGDRCRFIRGRCFLLQCERDGMSSPNNPVSHFCSVSVQLLGARLLPTQFLPCFPSLSRSSAHSVSRPGPEVENRQRCGRASRFTFLPLGAPAIPLLQSGAPTKTETEHAACGRGKRTAISRIDAGDGREQPKARSNNRQIQPGLNT